LGSLFVSASPLFVEGLLAGVLDRHGLLGMNDFPNNPFLAARAEKMSFLSRAERGFHVKGIFLKILEDQRRIANWEMAREDSHHLMEKVTEVRRAGLRLRKPEDFIKTHQLRNALGSSDLLGCHGQLLSKSMIGQNRFILY
jgi:hypothetical protein